MAIRITNFVGERPRSNARAIGLEASQINRNLLATATEFRPVNGAVQVAVATDFYNPVPNAKALHRRLHGPTGVVRTNDSDGWYATSADVNIVKGQLVDDTKERSYVSYNNGLTPPRESDMENETTQVSYLLGVPAPSQPQVKLLEATYFTMDKAVAWRDNTYLPAVLKAVQDNLVESRYTATSAASGTTTAGVTAAHFRSPYLFSINNQRGQSEPVNILIEVPLSTVNITTLDDQRLGGVKDTVYNRIAFPACPKWGTATNHNSIKAALLAIKNPRKSDGSALWDNSKAAEVALGLTALFDPTGSDVSSLRDSLDQAFEDFTAAIYYAMQSTVGAPTNTPEPKLTDAKYTGWAYQKGYNSGVDNYVEEYKNAQYANWESDHAAWEATNSTYTAWLSKTKADNAKRVADAVAAQTKAADIIEKIEALYEEKKANLLDTLKANTDIIGLAKSEYSPNGIVQVDADKIIDDRFYVATFVTAWGEESAPSEFSKMLTCAHHDAVALFTPTVPVGYSNINRVRWYRSNAGSTSAALQFVSELSVTQTARSPISHLNGVSSPIPGPNGTTDNSVEWSDARASWVILNDLNPTAAAGNYPVKDNSHLQPGDTVGLRNPTTNVVTTKTWTGAIWVDNGPTLTGDVISARAHVDGLASSSLGKTLKTLEWATPPSSTTGAVTKYLAGLKSGPGGVMAGFIDNFIAFSEPYIPYAWPVRYQVPIEFPIVGLCAFGQSWFVGTKGNPYIIYGDSPDNYVPTKLDSSQACVSARSIVAGGGGVFYASPDGYCFAGTSGVQVVTQALFANEDWRKLDPSSIFAVIYDNVLYFWYTGNGGGCYGYDMTANKLTRHDLQATAVFSDVVTDAVYAAYDGNIYKLFYGDRMTGLFRTGVLVLPKHATHAWLQVWGDQSLANQATVRIYAEGVLWHTATVSSTLPLRLPVGRHREIEIEVESKARITDVHIAGNTQELQSL